MGLFRKSTWILLLTSASVLEGHSSNHNEAQNNYSLARQISLDPAHETIQIEGETESVAFYHGNAGDDGNVNNHNHNQREDGSKLLSAFLPHSTSSLSGGAFVAMAECQCSFPTTTSEMEEDNVDDDDDDDDDDDGHSSMLSSASLRRSLVSVNVGGESKPYLKQNKRGSLKNSNDSNHHHQSLSMKCMKKKSLNKTLSDSLLLNIRGGSFSSSTISSIFLDEFSKRLVTAAFVTLLYEGTVGHVLEFLKIVKQTSPPGTTYFSILENITKEKGFSGVYDGFIPWGFLQATMKGGVFGLAHAIAKSNLQTLVNNNILPQLVALTLAGGIAGGFQGYVLSPTLLLKTRVMTNPVFRQKMGLVETTYKSISIGFDIVNHEGIFALMKGANIFALKRIFDWSTRYYFSDIFESMLLKWNGNEKLTPIEQVSASLLGGTASTLVTLPLDVIVAKSQDAKKADAKSSAWEIFIQDYKDGGLKGLYDANMQGFEARLAHVCFTTVVMKTGAPLMYDFLFSKK